MSNDCPPGRNPQAQNPRDVLGLHERASFSMAGRVTTEQNQPGEWCSRPHLLSHPLHANQHALAQRHPLGARERCQERCPDTEYIAAPGPPAQPSGRHQAVRCGGKLPRGHSARQRALPMSGSACDLRCGQLRHQGYEPRQAPAGGQQCRQRRRTRGFSQASGLPTVEAAILRTCGLQSCAPPTHALPWLGAGLQNLLAPHRNSSGRGPWTPGNHGSAASAD